ncbi:MAG: hypothetical protein GTN38_04235, partial [Candidatus Aenigmarchaeota archaeon]|nr:hypothetical protein [Candidatus Aenigmarchaeota archaeon]NIP40871.1 hypothetical protein [Candidatus Aenigmarchaeota archaeon]NIQ17985.1 hypothetical protein [Candidatus Aenigmarchaeota archaeon]NIS73574.1 hypothetical protein [Candidatus Aenigmarchaeota archaeon]
MTKLIGVQHGDYSYDPFTGETVHEIKRPGGGLIQKIVNFPEGTRIGVEYMDEKDWETVRHHLEHLQKDLPPDHEKLSYHQDNPARSYWEYLIGVSRAFGHEIVFLEKPGVWLEYNDASMKTSKLKEEVIEDTENGDYFDHLLKLLKLNEDIHRAKTEGDLIVIIKREEGMLEAIRSYNPDVAIAGIGHTDYWAANPDEMMKKYGITFEDYMTEIIKDDKYIPRKDQVFTEKAVSDPHNVFLRKGLGRAKNFLEKGRITSVKPDYVGTWDIEYPSRGFFEMFIEEKGKDGFLRGRIEDCLGSADFECTPSPGRFDFSKRYRENECARNTQKGWIEYESEGDEKKGYFHGYYESTPSI